MNPQSILCVSFTHLMYDLPPLYSLGDIPSSQNVNNHSIVTTTTESELSSLQLSPEELIFLILATFVLYCYMSCLRNMVANSGTVKSKSGLTKAEINDRLHAFRIQDTDIETEDIESQVEDLGCPICLEKWEYGVWLRKLPCAHIFHVGRLLYTLCTRIHCMMKILERALE